MDIDKIFHVLEYTGGVLSSGSVAIAVFIELSISIIIAFSLRICLTFKGAKIKFFGEKEHSKQRAIILNHCGLEILINFIFSYLLLIVLNTNSRNFITNMIFAPLLGQVISICIDDWYLIPKEKDSIYSKFNKEEDVPSTNTISNLVQIHGMIDSSLAKSEDFRPVIIEIINDIKKVQQEHEDKISDIQQKCDTTIDCLQVLQKAAMRDKKIALKQEIYDCLNAGFVTPRQRDQIQTDYESYCELGGNHEVEKLFENHFLSLPVHEDRRIQKCEVNNERRKGQKYEYGSLDNEEKTR